MNKVLLRALPHVVAVIVFITVAAVYFSPVWDGYELAQGDVAHFKGMSKEIGDHRMLYEEEPLWTNAMFSGMPAWQISVLHEGNWLKQLEPWFYFNMPRPVGILFLCMLGFYLFCLFTGVNAWLAIAGAIGFGLSTVNLLYLSAGHTSKVNAIAYMAPALGAMIMAFRRHILAGTALFALFLSLHLAANHLQMTYYLVFILGAVGITELVRLALKKDLIRAMKVSGALLAAGLLAVLPNWSNLITTYEYAQYSTRGKSELSAAPGGAEFSTTSEKGLETKYILEYNFGKGEAWSLLIPDAKGGHSAYLGDDKEIIKKVVKDQQLREMVSQQMRYWGEQKFSGGAFYFGAIFIFFFIMALVFSKDVLRWPFIILGLLALGLCTNDPGGMNDFFIHKFPMYNKFRDSKMILVILMIIIPALAVMFIQELLNRKPEEIRSVRKWMLIGGGSFVFVMILIVATPTSFFKFLAPAEHEAIAEYEKQYKGEQLQMVYDVFDYTEEVRTAIFQEDAQRSLFLVIIAFGALAALIMLKKNREIVAGILALVVLGDMWTVNQRYLNDEKKKGKYVHYVSAEEKSIPYTPRVSDMAILEREGPLALNMDETASSLLKAMKGSPLYKGVKDEQLLNQIAGFGALNMGSDYRVLNLSGPMSDATTSYFHKSLGGYHGAKLKKYQELYDVQLAPELKTLIDSLKAGSFNTALAQSHIINMLNAKYLVGNSEQPPLENKYACGNGWFPEEVKVVATADEEILAVGEQDARKVSVVRSGSGAEGVKANGPDSTAFVSLQSYKPNHLTFRVNSANGGLVVFSEIYYPAGWKCILDGQEVPYYSANYVLRALDCPAGEHQVEWIFDGSSFKSASTVSMAGSGLLILLLLGSLFMAWRARKQEVKSVS